MYIQGSVPKSSNTAFWALKSSTLSSIPGSKSNQCNLQRPKCSRRSLPVFGGKPKSHHNVWIFKIISPLLKSAGCHLSSAIFGLFLTVPNPLLIWFLLISYRLRNKKSYLKTCALKGLMFHKFLKHSITFQSSLAFDLCSKGWLSFNAPLFSRSPKLSKVHVSCTTGKYLL